MTVVVAAVSRGWVMGVGGIKSVDAARMLNLSYTRLMNLIRYGHIPRPPTDTSGDLWWGRSDLRRARAVLDRRRRAAEARAAAKGGGR